MNGPLISSQLLRNYATAMEAKVELDGRNAADEEKVDTLFQQALAKNSSDSESRLAYALYKRKMGDNFGARMHLLKGMLEGTSPELLAEEYISLLRELGFHDKAVLFLKAISKLDSQQVRK